MPTKTKTPDELRLEQAGKPPGVLERLQGELVELHRRCGREVLYIADDGRVLRYYPNRYLQGLRRAKVDGDLTGYVERIVLDSEPSEGFKKLWVAGKLELTVEAKLIEFCDEVGGVFSEEAYDAAMLRLARAVAKSL
jgi:hypothetical protein